MGRVLGVDLGTRRVGLALSDPGRTFGSPFATLSFSSEAKLVEEIARLCAEQAVELVVIGMPFQADGTEGEGCARARRVRDKLEARRLRTVLQDEAWTSRDAEATLRQSGKTRRNSREAVDRIAAALILKDYLESGRGS